MNFASRRVNVGDEAAEEVISEADLWASFARSMAASYSRAAVDRARGARVHSVRTCKAWEASARPQAVLSVVGAPSLEPPIEEDDEKAEAAEAAGAADAPGGPDDAFVRRSRRPSRSARQWPPSSRVNVAASRDARPRSPPPLRSTKGSRPLLSGSISSLCATPLRWAAAQGLSCSVARTSGVERCSLIFRRSWMGCGAVSTVKAPPGFQRALIPRWSLGTPSPRLLPVRRPRRSRAWWQRTTAPRTRCRWSSS